MIAANCTQVATQLAQKNALVDFYASSAATQRKRGRAGVTEVEREVERESE